MTFYHSIISAATGERDPQRLQEIEDCMRNVVFHSTLDWQSREQLEAGAKQAVKVLKEVE